MLGQLEEEETIVLCDLEAGVGTLLRLEADQADIVLIVVQPTRKSIEVGIRAAATATDRNARAIIVANQLHDHGDLEMIRQEFDRLEIVSVPYDEVIDRADRLGEAPIDIDESAPGVRAIVELGESLLSGV